MENNVNILFADKQVVNITIDPDKLLWEDMLTISEMQEKVENGELTPRQQLVFLTDLLTKMTGIDMTKQPSRVVNELIQQLVKIGGGSEETKN